MSDISVEKKLELVNQIRSRYHQNQSDLMCREQILYGRSTPTRTEYREKNEYGARTEYRYSENNMVDAEEGIQEGFLKLRFLLAIVLLLTIIVFDKSGKSFAGISMEQVFQTIETDYEDAVDAWIETASDSSK